MYTFPRHLLSRAHARFAASATAFALAVLMPLAMSAPAHARDMQARLGLGYNGEFANSFVPGGIPAVSLKYGLTRDIAVEGVVGVATTTPANNVAAVKFFKNLFYETNLNFYYMIGGGVLNANANAGAQFLSGFGAEFFIPGIESLGFSMEVGGSFDNLSGSFALKTMGLSFLNAGMHFYF